MPLNPTPTSKNGTMTTIRIETNHLKQDIKDLGIFRCRTLIMDLNKTSPVAIHLEPRKFVTIIQSDWDEPENYM